MTGQAWHRCWSQEMVADMKPGSVIIDIAAETGGNCELTEAGRDGGGGRRHYRGPVNLPSDMATGGEPILLTQRDPTRSCT